MLFTIKISEQQAFAIACQESESRGWGVLLRDCCDIQLHYKMCRLHWYIEGRSLPECFEDEEWPFIIAIDVEQGSVAYACSKNKSREVLR